MSYPKLPNGDIYFKGSNVELMFLYQSLMRSDQDTGVREYFFARASRKSEYLAHVLYVLGVSWLNQYEHTSFLESYHKLNDGELFSPIPNDSQLAKAIFVLAKGLNRLRLDTIITILTLYSDVRIERPIRLANQSALPNFSYLIKLLELYVARAKRQAFIDPQCYSALGLNPQLPACSQFLDLAMGATHELSSIRGSVMQPPGHQQELHNFVAGNPSTPSTPSTPLLKPSGHTLWCRCFGCCH